MSTQPVTSQNTNLNAEIETLTKRPEGSGYQHYVGYFDDMTYANCGISCNGTTYPVNFQSWGEGELTQAQIDRLRTRYDFDDMSSQDMVAFFSDLSQSGLAAGTRAADAMIVFAGIGAGSKSDSMSSCASLRDLRDYYESQLGKTDGLRYTYNFSTVGASFNYYNALGMDSSFYSKMSALLSALLG